MLIVVIPPRISRVETIHKTLLNTTEQIDNIVNAKTPTQPNNPKNIDKTKIKLIGVDEYGIMLLIASLINDLKEYFLYNAQLIKNKTNHL